MPQAEARHLAGTSPAWPTYQAFGIELLYNKEQNQVTIYATITTSTPHTIAALVSDSEPPTRSDSPQPTPGGQSLNRHARVTSRRLITEWTTDL